MKLQELTGYKKATDYQNSTIQQYLVRLQQSHNLEIRNGKFALVLIPQDGNYVYKLWTKDDAFDSWVAICRENQSLSFIPKILGRTKKISNVFVRRSSASDYINVMQMEKLNPISDEISESAAFLNLRRYLDSSLEEYDDTCLKYLTKIGGEDLSNFAKNIKIFLKNNHSQYRLDLHGGNVMMRGNEYVLVDPYVETNWSSDNVARLPNQLDDYSFKDINDKTIYADSEKYIFRLGAKATDKTVSKIKAINSLFIWKSQEQLDKYDISVADWPSSWKIDRKFMETCEFPFPKQVVDVMINGMMETRELDVISMYSSMCDNEGEDDEYFYKKLANTIDLDSRYFSVYDIKKVFGFMDSIHDNTLHYEASYNILNNFISNHFSFRNFQDIIFPMMWDQNKNTNDALVIILDKNKDFNNKEWITAKTFFNKAMRDEEASIIDKRIVSLFA